MENIKLKPTEKVLLKMLQVQYLSKDESISFENWLILHEYAERITFDSEIKPQDECCSSCGQYNGHAIGCIYNISEF